MTDLDGIWNRDLYPGLTQATQSTQHLRAVLVFLYKHYVSTTAKNYATAKCNVGHASMQNKNN
jgi:hypothetical protein